eukprot:TRINITY_DN5020_c1_g1_i4.p1 TRINITY_DN5020_c1_g1~~TRINITY_DN5020_c1_g1_i4.p1  ORF type:complete len:852 (+),score=203.35 TRINITY_DN5020_c1_g1_i4:273-2828(+)
MDPPRDPAHSGSGSPDGSPASTPRPAPPAPVPRRAKQPAAYEKAEPPNGVKVGICPEGRDGAFYDASGGIRGTVRPHEYGNFGPPRNALSLHLGKMYHMCDPSYPEEFFKFRRFLTEDREPAGNDGRDNRDDDLILYGGQEIEDPQTGTVYELKSMLGKGTFAQCALALDATTRRHVALKVIKRNHLYHRQSLVEVDVLRKLQDRYGGDPDTGHIVQLLAYFEHSSHMCLVFELLGVNLFEIIKSNKYIGMKLDTIRDILADVLSAIRSVHELGIIHCDIKPENILLAQGSTKKVKLIDFGSACVVGRPVYQYIQSRFYRAPEVLLGCSYGHHIDLWSLGCVAAELFLGLPLFPGTDNFSMIYRITEMQGYPSPKLLHSGKEARKYFRRVGDSESGGAESSDERSMTPPAANGTPRPHQLPPKILPCHGFILRGYTEFYREVAQAPAPVFKRYFNYSKLCDIIDHYPLPKASLPPGQVGVHVEKERLWRRIFTDLLHGLLQPDPDQRWSADVALRHPFFGDPKDFAGEGCFHADIFLPEQEAARQHFLYHQSVLGGYSPAGSASAATTATGMSCPSHPGLGGVSASLGSAGGLLGSSPGQMPFRMVSASLPATPGPAAFGSGDGRWLGPGDPGGYSYPRGSAPHSPGCFGLSDASSAIPVAQQNPLAAAGSAPCASAWPAGWTQGMPLLSATPLVGRTPTQHYDPQLAQVSSLATSLGEPSWSQPLGSLPSLPLAIDGRAAGAATSPPYQHQIFGSSPSQQPMVGRRTIPAAPQVHSGHLLTHHSPPAQAVRDGPPLGGGWPVSTAAGCAASLSTAVSTRPQQQQQQQQPAAAGAEDADLWEDAALGGQWD